MRESCIVESYILLDDRYDCCLARRCGGMRHAQDCVGMGTGAGGGGGGGGCIVVLEWSARGTCHVERQKCIKIRDAQETHAGEVLEPVEEDGARG